MSFKTSIILFVLYFITASWSIGINESQFKIMIQVFEKYARSKYEIPSVIARQLRFRSDLANTTIDDKTLAEYLILLAKQNKNTDNWKEKGLTTYEVTVFGRMFNIQDKKDEHDGVLIYAELLNLIVDDLKLESDVQDKILDEFEADDSINALQFLAAILKHKPKGKGLDQEQIQVCSGLMKSDDYLDPISQKALLQTWDIVHERYDFLMEFDRFQTAALELQEFIVFWAEYNKETDENTLFFSSSDVRAIIHEFNDFDRNKDGLLNHLEFRAVSKMYFPREDPKKMFKCIVNPQLYNSSSNDLNNILGTTKNLINAAMYLNVKFFLCSGHN